MVLSFVAFVLICYMIYKTYTALLKGLQSTINEDETKIEDPSVDTRGLHCGQSNRIEPSRSTRQPEIKASGKRKSSKDSRAPHSTEEGKPRFAYIKALQQVDASSDTDSINNRSDPLVTEREPLLTKRGPIVTEREPLLTKRGPIVAERGSLVTEQGSLVTEREPLVTKRGPLVAKRGPLVNKRGLLVIEQRPVLMEREPLVTERGPLVTEQGPLVTERKDKRFSYCKGKLQEQKNREVQTIATESTNVEEGKEARLTNSENESCVYYSPEGASEIREHCKIYSSPVKCESQVSKFRNVELTFINLKPELNNKTDYEVMSQKAAPTALIAPASASDVCVTKETEENICCKLMDKTNTAYLKHCPHVLHQIWAMEEIECICCNTKIHFGNLALRCGICSIVCHQNCRSHLRISCSLNRNGKGELEVLCPENLGFVIKARKAVSKKLKQTNNKKPWRTPNIKHKRIPTKLRLSPGINNGTSSPGTSKTTKWYLNSFYKNQSMSQWYLDSTNEKDSNVSGGEIGTLEQWSPSTSPYIPAPIFAVLKEIEARGMSVPGIYRISGVKAQVCNLKERILYGKEMPDLKQEKIHVLCNVLKDILRSFREPIITYELWQDFANAAKMYECSELNDRLQELISKLPKPNQDTLIFLILHLRRVSESSSCKMSLSNLSIVFGPVIIGFSSAISDSMTMFSEISTQQAVMGKLLNLCDLSL